jgi:hypothetical protein
VICYVVQEVKTWSCHHCPFFYFHETVTLLWQMLGHHSTDDDDDDVSGGQCEVPVLVLLSARLLHEGPVAHSHQAHLQTIEMD